LNFNEYLLVYFQRHPSTATMAPGHQLSTVAQPREFELFIKLKLLTLDFSFPWCIHKPIISFHFSLRRWLGLETLWRWRFFPFERIRGPTFPFVRSCGRHSQNFPQRLYRYWNCK